jgi:DNA-binding transcriptional ArsR family regulator
MELNPFTRDLFKAETLVGRKNELALFERNIDAIVSKSEREGLAFAGVRGIGKTSLMRKFADMAEKRKCIAVLVHVRYGETPEELMKKILRYAANSALEKLSTGHISKKSLAFIEKFRSGALAGKMGANEFGEKLSSLYNELKHEIAGIVVLIDDVEDLENSRIALSEFSKVFKTLKSMPIGFVCSSTIYFKEFKDFCSELKVDALSAGEIKDSINLALRQSKVRMGDECLHSITEDSEGNPLILFNVCWTIYNKLGEKEKMIAKWHYLSYSSSIMGNLSQGVFDELYYRRSGNEREILKVFAALGGEANVSDLARKMDKKLNTITTLVLRLYESGNVIKVDRGRYRLFNRLYAKYLKEYV